MLRLIRFWNQLLFHVRRRRFERELDEEIQLHLDMDTGASRAAGTPDEEARHVASRRFGNATLVREASREMWGWTWIEDLGRDLCHALRMVRRRPGVFAVVVLTLALGIGANTAMFSVLYGVWLAPLEYAAPDRLVDVSIFRFADRRYKSGTSYQNLQDWRAQNRVFEDLAVDRAMRFVNLTGAGEAEEVQAHRVSANLFPLLGIRPLVGRQFAPEEDRASGPRSALLSYQYWASHFGVDTGAIGRRVWVDGEPFTIVGVMPPRTQFPPLWGAFSPVMWLSLNLAPEEAGARQSHLLSVVGRLKAGVSLERAQADMDVVAARLASAYPKENGGFGATVSPLKSGPQLQNIRPTLLLLVAASGLLLLIACTNVANLLLASAAGRAREFAIRTALGVSRWRLARQLLAEAGVMALAGGAAGVFLAFWTLPMLKAGLPASVPRAASIGINFAVLTFALATSLTTGVLFGLAPVFRARGFYLQVVLKQSSRHLSRPSWLGRLLVVVQVALAFVLVAAAGLLIESFHRLSGVDFGFARERVVTMRIQLAPRRYPTGQRVRSFREAVLERVRALPGADYAGTVSSLPLGIISQGTDFEIEGRPETARNKPFAGFAYVTTDYLRAMGIPLLRGRHFSDDDGPASPPVTIISQSLAQRYWPNSDAVGRRVRLEHTGIAEWFTVIGVVKDVRHFSPEKDPGECIYALTEQMPLATQGRALGRLMVLVIHTPADAIPMARAARSAIAEVDRDQPVADVMTMEQMIAKALAGRRLNMVLIALFAALGLALATVGVFGVVSYSVARRTNEIGIRMALGAQRSSVLAMVVRQALEMALAGVIVGGAAYLVLSRLLTHFVYGVKPANPMILAGAALGLLAAALAAGYMPARRATRIDPAHALRQDE